MLFFSRGGGASALPLLIAIPAPPSSPLLELALDPTIPTVPPPNPSLSTFCAAAFAALFMSRKCLRALASSFFSRSIFANASAITSNFSHSDKVLCLALSLSVSFVPAFVAFDSSDETRAFICSLMTVNARLESESMRKRVRYNTGVFSILSPRVHINRRHVGQPRRPRRGGLW